MGWGVVVVVVVVKQYNTACGWLMRSGAILKKISYSLHPAKLSASHTVRKNASRCVQCSDAAPTVNHHSAVRQGLFSVPSRPSEHNNSGSNNNSSPHFSLTRPPPPPPTHPQNLPVVSLALPLYCPDKTTATLTGSRYEPVTPPPPPPPPPTKTHFTAPVSLLWYQKVIYFSCTIFAHTTCYEADWTAMWQ